MSDVATLAAGRELDALIAEKVMGIPVYWHHYYPDLTNRHGPYLDHQSSGESMPRDVPRFSTDIAAAWQVYLKAMDGLFSQRQRFYDALQEQTRQKEKDGATIVDSELRVAWPDVLTVLRHEMPLAICRAALAVVEGR